MEEKRGLWTIPNLLSVVRLCLIPVVAWLYCIRQDAIMTAAVLTLSGITDVVDGWIARRFHMISDVGKALDPIADKLTQAVMLICLLTRFPILWTLVILMAVKETFMGITACLVLRKTGRVEGACWHGKVNTCMLYALMALHLLWRGIPREVSIGLTAACAAMMILSMALYGIRNIRLLKKER